MSITPWLPGFAHVDLDLTGVQAPEVGRPYDELSRPKICLHTTEGSTLAGAERAFAAYPPHIGVDPRTKQRHQYLPLDRCSFSLKGSESDDEFVVQVEIVGFAGMTPSMSDAHCDWLGASVLAPIARAIGCPLVPAPQGFKAPGDVSYPLASTSSKIRFRGEGELRAFTGVFGHQHAPSPDTHWDPGGIRIDRILTAARGDDFMANLSEEEQRELLRKTREIHGETATNDDGCRLRETLLLTRALAGGDPHGDPLETADLGSGGEARPLLKTLVQGAVLDGLRAPDADHPDRGDLRPVFKGILDEWWAERVEAPPTEPPAPSAPPVTP